MSSDSRAKPDRSDLGIGVDFGTTNSAAAIFDGQTVRLVRLEEHQDIMPSATYIDKELQSKTGEAAINRYIEDNSGRTVEMIPEVIGESSMLVGDYSVDNPKPVETITKKIYGLPLTDSGLQGRLFRGVKRLLGNKNLKRLMVFNHAFRPVALITPMLLRIRKSIEKQALGFSHACLGHPVNFEGKDEHHNKLALSRLGEAYEHAGIKTYDFYPEPIAATVSYLHANPKADGRIVLTVDFGGGTLDTCVLRRRGAEEFEVIATHGTGLGGDHIDQAIFRELLFPLLGEGETWVRRGEDKEIETEFPFKQYADMLLNWAVTYVLNQNKYTTPVLECLEQEGPARVKFRRLKELIQQNYGYLVFQKIKEFKARLSTQESAVLDIPEIDVEVHLTRGEFETLIAPQLETFRRTVDETLEIAGLQYSDIDLVLRTGGSSLIPAVLSILEERFAGKVVEHDPFTSVATGLAIADYYGYAKSA